MALAPWHGKRADPNSPVKIQIRVSIPKTFGITAQNNLGCFFVRNEQLWQLPVPDDADVYLFGYSARQGFTKRYQYAERFIRFVGRSAICCCNATSAGRRLFRVQSGASARGEAMRKNLLHAVPVCCNGSGRQLSC
jgi:hypothetical protein